MVERRQKYILLINPPIHSTYYKFHACQPVGLLRIGTYLRQQGHKVKMIDSLRDIDCNLAYYLAKKREKKFVRWEKCGNFKGSKLSKKIFFYGIPWSEFRQQLAEENPDEIWIGSTMTYYWEGVHQAVKICKEMHPDAKVVVGGLYATLCPEHAKKSGADEVFQGELFPASDCPTAIDLLPKIPNYAVIKSTRGCPNNCSYCAVHKLEGRKMRYRSPEAVVAEIEEKISRYSIRSFVFWESNLLMNTKQHFEKMLDLIIEKKLNISLRAPEGLAPNLVYEELAVKMKTAGFCDISLPLESASDEMCKKRFHRVSKLDDLKRAVRIFKKAGFKRGDITIFVLAGMQGQSIEDVLKSFIEVWKLDAKIMTMPFTPIPGTEEFGKYRHLIKDKGLHQLSPGLWCFARNNRELMQLEECLQITDKPDYLRIQKGWNKQKTQLVRKIERIIRKEIKGQEERKKILQSMYGDKTQEHRRVDIRMGYRCNNNCRFCCNEKRRANEAIETEKIKEILLAWKKNDMGKVVFTGGEPTIRRDLPELISLANGLGYKAIQIITNGRMLSYENYLEKLVDTGLTNVCLSIPAMDESEFDYLTRVEGSYRQVMQAIENIGKTNLVMQTITPITKRNYKRLPEIAAFLAELTEDAVDFGAEFVFLNPEGNAWLNRAEFLPKYSEVRPFVKKALDVAREKGLRLGIEDVPFCLMRRYKRSRVELHMAEERLYVDTDGIKKDLNRARAVEGKVKAEQCRKCRYDNICEGVWKNYAKVHGLHELKAVPGRKIKAREEVFIS